MVKEVVDLYLRYEQCIRLLSCILLAVLTAEKYCFFIMILGCVYGGISDINLFFFITNNCSLGLIFAFVQLRNVLGLMRRGGNLRFEVSFISN